MEIEEVIAAQHAMKKLQIIDVRNADEYEHQHIPEAIHIALSDLPQAMTKLDPNVQFITVCGKGGGRSAQASQLLKEHGFNAIWLCGGTWAWFSQSTQPVPSSN